MNYLVTLACIMALGGLVTARSTIDGAEWPGWKAGAPYWWVWLTAIIIVASILGAEVQKRRDIEKLSVAIKTPEDAPRRKGRRHYNPDPPIDS